MLRVNRFAAAIDMMAAGTRAPIAIAENATPANQSGNWSSKNFGTTSCGFGLPSRPIGLVPTAIAAKPSSASTSEYAGRMAALRRITLRLREDRTAVIECGYMNSASAEPSASVAYARYCDEGGMNTPVGLPVAGLVELIFFSAASNVAPNPIFTAT